MTDPTDNPISDEATAPSDEAADAAIAEDAPEGSEDALTPEEIKKADKQAVDWDTETSHADRDPDLYERSLANAKSAAACADEMRGTDIVILDMTKIASIVDFFVICTATSRRQMHAIADQVNRKLKGEEKNERLGIEGYRTEANWILVDFGDIVLHAFTPEGRELYDLENLKADATKIDWQPNS